MPKGIEIEEYLKEVDLPINKNERYLYQINKNLIRLIELLMPKEPIVAFEVDMTPKKGKKSKRIDGGV